MKDTNDKERIDNLIVLAGLQSEMIEIANILTEAADMGCDEIPFMQMDNALCMKIPCHRCKEARLLVFKGYHRQIEEGET